MNISIIEKIVYKTFNLTPQELRLRGSKGKMSHLKKFVVPRRIVYFFADEFLDLSLNETGKFYTQDHATVIHGVKKIRGYLTYDKELIRLLKVKNEDLCGMPV